MYRSSAEEVDCGLVYACVNANPKARARASGNITVKRHDLKDFSEMTDKVKISSSFTCLSDMYSETSENYRERFHFSSLDQLTQCSRV